MGKGEKEREKKRGRRGGKEREREKNKNENPGNILNKSPCETSRGNRKNNEPRVRRPSSGPSFTYDKL